MLSLTKIAGSGSGSQKCGSGSVQKFHRSATLTSTKDFRPSRLPGKNTMRFLWVIFCLYGSGSTDSTECGPNPVPDLKHWPLVYCGGQVRWIHRFILERWFFCEENKGLTVIGTFYFKALISLFNATGHYCSVQLQIRTKKTFTFSQKINALKKWLIIPPL
jgi:hypothetical protein